MDLTNALEKSLSTDTLLSRLGQKILENNLQANFQEYVKTLSDVINRETYGFPLRAAAAIKLRRALISSDDFRCLEAQHRWSLIQDCIRQYIIKNLLASLVTDETIPSVVAECLAAVGCAEFGACGKSWQSLMTILIDDSLSVKSTKMLQAASLDAIGYICRDLHDWNRQSDLVIKVSAEVHQSICNGLKQQDSKHARLAAINALNNALNWIVTLSMIKESDKQELMQLICETASSDSPAIKICAVNCLTYILADFYDSMHCTLDEELFDIIVEAMTHQKYQVLVAGTKLCNKVCYLESCLFKQRWHAAYPMRKERFFSDSRLLQQLTIITELLEIYGEKDEDNVRETLEHCLTSLVLCYDDSFVRKYVANFVEDNVYHPNWQYRNAAIRMFSSLVTDEMVDLQVLLNETVRLLIEMLSDCSCEVKAAAAHVISKVFDHVVDSSVFEPNLEALLNGLMRALNEKPLVASYVCHAFARFAVAVRTFDVETCFNITCFYDMFPQIIRKLLDTINRVDADNDLRMAACHALDCLLDHCSKCCYTIVLKSAEIVLKKLQSLQHQLEAVLMCSKHNHLISVLCITLKLFLKNLRPEDSRPICFKAMNVLVHIFCTKSFDMDCVDEKVLLAFTTFVKMLGRVFNHYLAQFRPCLFAALRSSKKYSLLAAVNLTATICQAVGCKFYLCCDELVPILLDILQNVNTDRHLMHTTLSAMGILAQVSGPYFRKFLRSVLQTVVKMQSKLDEVHLEKIVYERGYNLCEMHKHFLRVYVGLVQSMKNDHKTLKSLKLLLKPNLMNMINVIIHIMETRSYLTIYEVTWMEMLSNLCAHFSNEVLPRMDTQAIECFLVHARNSKNQRAKKQSLFINEQLQKLKTSSLISIV
uniref:Importin N-terminal domain-containing protein n=1 Tax=Strigamia maritima TaxID=126957 RepID=T1JHU0_STRMM